MSRISTGDKKVEVWEAALELPPGASIITHFYGTKPQCEKAALAWAANLKQRVRKGKAGKK